MADGCFYLADLLSEKDKTLEEKLYVLLKTDHYIMQIATGSIGGKLFEQVAFSNNQRAYKQFWNRYERPPLR
ncbi:MAG: hypothetical protein FWD57_01590 [Polyangiaceae bacterium]|nr:hypothetical protein [Polyangiaceae bacterium]